MMDCCIIDVCGREVKTVVLEEMGWFAMDNDRGESSNGVINGVDETQEPLV